MRIHIFNRKRHIINMIVQNHSVTQWGLNALEGVIPHSTGLYHKLIQPFKNKGFSYSYSNIP